MDRVLSLTLCVFAFAPLFSHFFSPLICFLPFFFNVNSFTVSFVSAHPAMKVEDIVKHTRRYWRFLKIISKLQTD